MASDLHPDHDTLAHFRKTFLRELQELFVQISLLAQAAEILKLGNMSIEGSQMHADASQSKAESYKRLVELETQIRQEVAELMTLGEPADQGDLLLPEGLVIPDEIGLRRERLAKWERAKERCEAEPAEYQAKLQEREEKSRRNRPKPRGPQPQPPEPDPRAKDQFNFTDPESRITPAPNRRCGVKNSPNPGVDQPYNVQVAVDQASRLILAPAWSKPPHDQQEAGPTVEAISPKLGQPKAAALDNGYFSAANLQIFEDQPVEAYIATGREPHHQDWRTFFQPQPEPPAEDASPKVKMAYKLQTEIGQTIYRLRKCTVEPVIGLIKEGLGFRQFSLRGLAAAAGEGCLVCLAFRLRRQAHAHLEGRVGVCFNALGAQS